MQYAIDVPLARQPHPDPQPRRRGRQGSRIFRADDRPPVGPPFFAFRIMVGIGLLMLAIVVLGWSCAAAAGCIDQRWFLLLCQAARRSASSR